jgi:phenylacetate-CoA ligase
VNLFKRVFNIGCIGVRAAIERRIPSWQIERIGRLQKYRVRSIVRHTYETVPFYRDAMEQRGLRPENFRSADDLARLPLLDDVTVRNDPDQFASARYGGKFRRVIPGSTNAQTE